MVHGQLTLPVLVSNTAPVNPILLALGNEAIMAAFAGLMTTMQVRGRGFKKRV